MTKLTADSRSVFHPLDERYPRPTEMNNPFCYEPHPLCKAAAKAVCESAYFAAIRQEALAGKMFGVLVAEDGDGRLGFLAAYSGQIGGQHDWAGFVPAIFDYLQPDGYFKRQEALISSMNQEIAVIGTSDRYTELRTMLQDVKEKNASFIEDYKQKMEEAKQQRILLRNQPDADQDALIRESQFMKAELRRIKKRQAEQVGLIEARIGDVERKTEALKYQRRKQSDELQRWLFSNFVLVNSHGESRNLLDIFAETVFKTPPSGAGECCEPKLLQYAFAHGLRPLCMAMFWYGESPKAEVRHHLHYYPACNGKCRPILTWMLGPEICGDRPVIEPEAPVIRYEDATLMVIEKPSGLLSVPGKSHAPSVESLIRLRCPEAEGPLMVHRLDQDTSGLMVIAKTMASYHHLQRQFASRSVCKRYIAKLTHPLSEHQKHPSHGVISLPLWSDPMDRPYQKVDYEKGKEAESEYRFLSDDMVELTPHTGRTHQLRVHCAHRDGLDNPILGDNLYGDGTPAPRLCLHASFLSFVHPMSGERLTFSSEPTFDFSVVC